MTMPRRNRNARYVRRPRRLRVRRWMREGRHRAHVLSGLAPDVLDCTECLALRFDQMRGVQR